MKGQHGVLASDQIWEIAVCHGGKVPARVFVEWKYIALSNGLGDVDEENTLQPVAVTGCDPSLCASGRRTPRTISSRRRKQAHWAFSFSASTCGQSPAPSRDAISRATPRRSYYLAEFLCNHKSKGRCFIQSQTHSIDSSYLALVYIKKIYETRQICC